MNKRTTQKMVQIAVAALLLLGMVIGMGCSEKSSGASSDAPVTAEMFWGKVISNKVKYQDGETNYDDFMSYREVQVCNIDGQDIEFSAFPVEIAVDPSSGRMRILFLDRFVTKYCLEGTFEIKKNVLEFHPEALIDSMDADWSSTKDLKNTITPDYIDYPVVIAGTTRTLYVKSVRMQYKNSYTFTDDTYTLQGTVSAGSEAFKEIQEINAVVVKDEKDTPCKVLFQDGSFPTDPVVSSLYENAGTVKWDNVEKDYNGRREVFKEYGYASIYYIDTRPYGFIVIDSSAHKSYRYQDPLKTLSD